MREDSPLSARFVLSLVEHLPDDSAFISAMRGGRIHRPWTLEARLLASTVNLLFAANRQRAGQKTRQPLVTPPKPKVSSKRRTVTVAQLAARAATAAKTLQSS